MAAPVYNGGVALPGDDSLSLDASDDGPLVVDRVGPIWQTLDDLKALMPAVLRGGTSAVRDAWLQTWGQAALVAQTRFGFVVEAQASPRFAEGLGLDAWGELLNLPRGPGEIDGDYRSRLMRPDDLVSPAAIKAAVNAVLAASNLSAVIYNEPAVDQAFCGPATTSDTTIINGRRQTIGALQTWFAFTQPQIPLSGVIAIHQSVYYAQNLRFWANYTGQTGNTSIGAFSAPLGAGFWIIAQAPIGDDGLTPHSEPVAFSTSAGTGTVGLDASDFTQGIAFQDIGQYQPGVYDPFFSGGPFFVYAGTPHQSVVQNLPLWTTAAYGYVPAAYDTVIDRINIEVSRRKAAGVPWVAMVDYPVQYTR